MTYYNIVLLTVTFCNILKLCYDIFKDLFKAYIDDENIEAKGMYGNSVTLSIRLIFTTISALIKKHKPEPNKNFFAVNFSTSLIIQW